MGNFKNQFKRDFLINQLIQLGVKEINGKKLSQLDHETLHQTLAVKRATAQ